MRELEENRPVVYNAINGGRVFKDKMHNVSILLKDIMKGQKINAKKPRFKSELVNPQGEYFMADFGADGLSSPLDPKVKLYGVEADKCTIFRSAI